MSRVARAARVVATSTPDMIFPSTACIVQHKLGAAGCPAFDLQAVCSGFVYALYGLAVSLGGNESILWYERWAYKNR